MKTNLLLLLAFPIIAVVVISFSSCEKETQNTATTEESLTAINEYTKAAEIFKDAFNEVNDAAKHVDDSLAGKTTKGQFSNDQGPAITITPFDLETWPKTITVDYGTDNMLCEDYRERRGIINIVASDFYHNTNCTMTVTFDNFFQNDNKVEGTKTIVNQGENEANNLVYSVAIEDGKITTTDNVTFYFEQNTTREWTEGDESINPWDDVYMIKGNQNGISSDSISYTLTIQEGNPLDVLIGCHWIRAGILDIDIEGVPTITLDYGDGVCDNAATVTINGEEYLISMQ